MQEAKRVFGRIVDTISSKVDGINGVENSETLMQPDRVEQLVQEGRPPLRLGSIGSLDGEAVKYPKRGEGFLRLFLHSEQEAF